MWINGIPIPSSTSTLAYIIWKDYNCDKWQTISSMREQSLTFTSEQLQQIGSFQFPAAATDVWDTAFRFIEHVNSQTLLRNGGYSVVMSQDDGPGYRGYLCLVNNNYYLENDLITGQGSYLLFQTR